MDQTREIIIKQKDGYKTQLHVQYSNLKYPKASILILHGMCEHYERYQLFTDYLVNSGFDIYRYDHRGHGRSLLPEQLGYIAKHHGDQILISDGIQIMKYIKKHNRTNRSILIGHSMGSLIGRNIIQRYDHMDGAIFIGTACPPIATSMLGHAIGSIFQMFKGASAKSKFLNHLMLENATFRKMCQRTPYDWLTRDCACVNHYMQDPYCGFASSISLLKDIASLSYHASVSRRIARTRHDLPLLLLSGTMDPVGNLGHDIQRLYRKYQKLSFLNVKMTLYKDCRHELLNEINKQMIMSDIVQWIEKELS